MTGLEKHAGFNVTSSKLQVVEIDYDKGQFLLSNIDEAYFSETLNFEKDKETKLSALLQGAFNELLIKKPLKSTFASFTLPMELFYLMQIPYDNSLLHQDLIEEFRWEFSVLYPYVPSDDLVIQYLEVEKNDFIPYNTAIIYAIQRRYLQFIENFCRSNNLQLKFIDNIHSASERALTLSNSPLSKGLILSIYFNNKFLSVIYSLEGKPIYQRVLPLNDVGEVPTYLLSETTAKENFNINRGIIEKAYITGDDISGTIVESLENILGIEFIHFNPFTKIKPESKLYENKNYIERNNSFSSAAGIAYRLA